MTEGPSGERDVSQISISSRIPDFWEDLPRPWFIQLEAVVQSQKLTDAAKYHLVIAKLGKRVIQQVTDILVNPPEQDKYEGLKSRLLNIFEESQVRQIQKLIGEMDLGDQKPSQLLRKMKDLARDKVGDETLLILWQNHLPPSVRAVLAVSDTKDINTLASVADKVMESTRPIGIQAVESDAQTSNIDSILAEIAKLTMRLDKIEKNRSRPRQRCRSSSRRFSQSRSRGRSSGKHRRTPQSEDWLCYYHYNYKDKAHKCLEPCAWKKTPGN